MADLRWSGAPTAVALGFFDGVHLGHVKVIHMAKAQNLKTVVVTFSHNPGKTVNGQAVPEITSLALKERIFESLSVDAIVYLDFDKVRDMAPEEFIDMLTQKLNVKYISCGFNYRFGKNAAAGVSELETICISKGIELCPVSPVMIKPGITLSSTRIRSYISAGDVKGASKLLGRYFAFYGEVVHGNHIGRTLGMPTINQLLNPPQLIPRFGVYASLTHLNDKLFPSVTNVGVKPTVSRSGTISAETYIQGFNGDLYGKIIQVDLVDFLRPEKKFDSIGALKNQIKADNEKARIIVESNLA